MERKSRQGQQDQGSRRKPQKLLVANRAEIACRIFQAARELGISTVAVYAPGDELARHVTFADEALEVPAYLDIEALLEVARKTGATLVHPGYGFLSERAPFAKAVEEAGIRFIGPRAETIELMGGKIAAKELCERIGVPTLPWAKAARQSDLEAFAKKNGFPLLLKAAAGGGGKGMRKVARLEELRESAESAKAEALSAFGDDALFIEKLVERPRHIEVQVFGDGQGGGVHLNERECSLQRRHQKVLEEAPAANLSETTRKGLFESAMKLVKETRYRSAGTLEFLVEGDRFYFLEMNTRLQVEHPVTELITGVDLVHAQIELALTGASPLKETPAPRGHAMEARLYAEDPAQGFRPSPGEIRAIRWPTGPGIRIDSGIETGQPVSTQFDSMLAKVIVHAPTRGKALARLKGALEETVVLGAGTNQKYLLALCLDGRVREADVSTQYLESEFKWEAAPRAESLEILACDPPKVPAGTGGFSTVSQAEPGFEAQAPNPWFAFGGAS